MQNSASSFRAQEKTDTAKTQQNRNGEM